MSIPYSQATEISINSTHNKQSSIILYTHYSLLPFVRVTVPVMSLTGEEQHPASTEQTMLEEMKPECGLPLEHNPQVGFVWQRGGGGGKS